LSALPEKEKKRKLAKDVIRVAVIIGVFVGAALLLRNEAVRDNILDIQTIRENLHPDESVSGQLTSYAVFLIGGGLLIALGMPRIWVSTVAGAIYGTVLGAALALTATMIGATGMYYIGRTMLRGVVKRRLGKRVNIWAERYRDNAFMWTLYARLFPISNASLTSIICGCCKVPIRTYMAANLIGFLPLTIIFAMFGSAAAKGKAIQLVVASALFVIAVLGQWWYTHQKKNSAADDE
jgi:uncharacterized membrane protein YdjX (TVP38/TMEM64 family)